jgi:hypothetical protein
MNGGVIENNASSTFGGGIYMAGNNTFNMDNDAIIRNNTAETHGGV